MDKMRMHSVYIVAEQFISVVRVIFSDSSHTVPEGIENQARPTPFDGFVIFRLIRLLFPEHGINSFDGSIILEMGENSSIIYLSDDEVGPQIVESTYTEDPRPQ